MSTPEEEKAAKEKKEKEEREAKEKLDGDRAKELDRVKLENTALRSIVINREIEAHGKSERKPDPPAGGSGGSGGGEGGAGKTPEGKKPGWIVWPWQIGRKGTTPPAK